MFLKFKLFNFAEKFINTLDLSDSLSANLNLVICRNDDDKLDTYYTPDGDKTLFDESMDDTSDNANKKPFDQYGFEINETSNR